MSESGNEPCPSVDWDAGIGILTLRADAAGAHAQRATVTFHSRVWISLDDHARPITVDLLDVPDVVARAVPRARRGHDDEPVKRGGIEWLLDPDSDWVWIPLGAGPDRTRLVREGRVEVLLAGDQPLRVRVWVPVSGATDRDGAWTR
ncbi:hypothetical protein [Streptomyces broussonetiae]|uniref:Uncharacterized protein n=1 Tax=Streptomyces broussonetiae TaxID=2686304 RepID=A0A6I6MYP2_9ACTN|nr:hypothetical protein [Streptomyces broussonetiae]QHA04452.1 hypothetical protein GQF42_15205 [Streptomyces broussonetiae]